MAEKSGKVARHLHKGGGSAKKDSVINRMTLGRAHTSTEAADVAKSLLLNKSRVAHILPYGVRRFSTYHDLTKDGIYKGSACSAEHGPAPQI